MNKRIATIIGCIALAGVTLAQDWQRAGKYAWGLLYPGNTLATSASLTVNSQDKWVRLQNQSTNRVWLSWGGLTNINAGVINLTQTNSGSTLVIVTNIVGVSTNIIGTGGTFLEPYGTSGEGDTLFIANPPGLSLYLLGENVVSNQVSYTKGQY